MNGLYLHDQTVSWRHQFPRIYDILQLWTYKDGWSWTFDGLHLVITIETVDSRMERRDRVTVVEGGLVAHKIRVAMSFLVPEWLEQWERHHRHDVDYRMMSAPPMVIQPWVNERSAGIAWVRACFAAAELHEMDEWITYAGERAFDPHGEDNRYLVREADRMLMDVLSGIRS